MAEIAKDEQTVNPESEEIDIDLNDPEVEKAALKIQAKFKGLKTGKFKKNSADANKVRHKLLFNDFMTYFLLSVITQSQLITRVIADKFQV